MEIADYQKLSKHIFRLLKVQEIVFPIGRTNKGNLGIRFSANTDEMEIVLDAVALSTKSMTEDDNNIELKKMIEKYWFEVDSVGIKTQNVGVTALSQIDTSKIVYLPSEAPKKRGRPTGSKNKK